jgi:hypothetical protein
MSEQETVDPFTFTIVEDKGETVIIEVSEEQYERDIKAGLSNDETLKPGRYKMRRGGFLKRHPELSGEVKKRA